MMRPSEALLYASAVEKAAPSSGCSGTILDFLPLPCRTRIVGSSASSDRSATSRANASDTLSPALYCSIIRSRALGSLAALMMAWTSWASRYSGSFFSITSGDCLAFLGYWPRGLRRRAIAVVGSATILASKRELLASKVQPMHT